MQLKMKIAWKVPSCRRGNSATAATADATLGGQPALFLTGYISPIFAHFSAIFSLLSPS